MKILIKLNRFERKVNSCNTIKRSLDKNSMNFFVFRQKQTFSLHFIQNFQNKFQISIFLFIFEEI
jgi:hypothetical protein